MAIAWAAWSRVAGSWVKETAGAFSEPTLRRFIPMARSPASPVFMSQSSGSSTEKPATGSASAVTCGAGAAAPGPALAWGSWGKNWAQADNGNTSRADRPASSAHVRQTDFML